LLLAPTDFGDYADSSQNNGLDLRFSAQSAGGKIQNVGNRFRQLIKKIIVFAVV